ncbi:hypothetical protein AC7_A0117 [Clostridium perfringens NCTC 8239]|nr:hypothetical protein AC7_A0117 [Clostridium perfringens NCTC 8239]
MSPSSDFFSLTPLSNFVNIFLQKTFLTYLLSFVFCFVAVRQRQVISYHIRLHKHLVYMLYYKIILYFLLISLFFSKI